MVPADQTDRATLNRHVAEQFSIAVIGDGPRAASLVRMLAETENMAVVAVCARQPGAPALRLGDELGMFTTRDVTEVFQVDDLDIVVDVSGDPGMHDLLVAQCPEEVEVLGVTGSGLMLDLLMAKKRGKEHERLFVELQVAYDQIRSHERKLEASRDALEKANAELENRVEEISFTHEFFKTLTGMASVDQVAALIVDGCSDTLHADISCVYLFRREDWTLRLAASHGRPESAFKQQVPVAETFLGRAYREGAIQETDTGLGRESTAWLTGECAIQSQAAVPLRTGDEGLGVIVIASQDRRELDSAEMERLGVLSDESSLSLQNAHLHAELQRLSVTDRLTELYNHGHFKQRLDEEFKRAARFGHSLSLIMLDLDDFKAFNDTFGHPRGDRLLKSVAGAITCNLRSMDLAARYGGEEFVVVLPETDVDGALAVAERIRADVEELRIEGPESAPVLKTISAGVATFPNHAASSLRLLESADAAMYRAKRGGKNRVVSAGS